MKKKNLKELDIKLRMVYDRAYGQAWFKSKPEEECHRIAMQAVDQKEKLAGARAANAIANESSAAQRP